MTVPENIRINTSVPFPAQVTGSGPVTISKQNGIWTVGFGVTRLQAVAPNIDPTLFQLPVYNSTLGVWQQATIANLVGGAYFTRTVTAAGSITVLPNDRVILVSQSVPAAASIVLPAAATRGDVPLTVKDLAGVAATNNLTLVPNGVETIDGANSFIINSNFETITINPLPSGGWWVG